MSTPPTLRDFHVIDQVAHHFDLTGRQPFQGFEVLAVQHLHSSMTPLVVALCRGGVQADQVTVVGKSYSTRLPAVEALRAIAVRVVDPLRMRDPLRSYEEELNEQVDEVLATMAPKLDGGRPLLVVDEGAVATKALLRRGHLPPAVFVVEQTTRGARWTDAAGVPFPVVDVARSAGKADLEGPLVATSMVDGLLDVLPLLDLRPSRIGVVGYGRMGSRLAALLSQRFDVAVYDVDERHRTAAHAAGLDVHDFDGLAANSDVLLGCTGTPILDDDALARIARPQLLVNCASSDIEFALWQHRTADAMLPGSAGDTGRPWLNHYAIGSACRQVLVAGGFPINFHGSGEPIAPVDFQVTRALMLAGAVQAVQQAVPGLLPLDDAVQQVVAEAYKSVREQAPE